MSSEAEQVLAALRVLAVLAALRKTGRVLRERGWSADYAVDPDSGTVGLITAVGVALGTRRVAFDKDTWWLERNPDVPDVGRAADMLMLVWDALRDTLRARGEGVPPCNPTCSVSLSQWGRRAGRTEAEVIALVDETIARLSAEQPTETDLRRG